MASSGGVVCCELVGLLRDVAYQRCRLLLQELRELHPIFVTPLEGLMEAEYFAYVREHQDKFSTSTFAELQKTTRPFVLLLDSPTPELLDGEDELLEFAMARTQLSKNELLAAAAFGKAAVRGDGDASDLARRDVAEKLARAEEELMLQAEGQAKKALQSYRQRSGHAYAYLVFDVDGVALPRVELELFQARCPRTCQNFLAFCQQRVPNIGSDSAQLGYQGNPVHRVVRDGWIQAGDVAGNGRGDGLCRSLYGRDFADESFSVPHDAAGILSMANTGPHTNGSQFFITLAPLPWLDRKKVAFGRVVSGWRTIQAIGNLETRHERPCAPCTIVDCGKLN